MNPMWPARFIHIDKNHIEERILSCYSRLSNNKKDLQETRQNLENLKQNKPLDQNMSGLVDFIIDALNNKDDFYERKVCVYLELAFYHHLNRDHPDIVKKVLKRGAEDYLQFLQNFKPKEKIIEGLAWKQTFRKNDSRTICYKEYEQDRRYYKVTYKVKDFLVDSNWLVAVFCCFGCNDQGLLYKIINQYQWPKSSESVDRPFLIQMLYLKNTEIAKEQMANYHKGYSVDIPPERREIMQGIVENNPSIFMDGIRKIHTRFTTMWTMSRFSKRGFSDHNKIVDDLINYRWGFSEWAIIGLHLARMNDLKLNYNDIPELFIPKYLYAE